MARSLCLFMTVCLWAVCPGCSSGERLGYEYGRWLLANETIHALQSTYNASEVSYKSVFTFTSGWKGGQKNVWLDFINGKIK